MGWVNYEKAGRSFDVLIQEEEADCGLCCIAMVVNLLGHGKPTSSMVKKNLPKGAYKPSTKDRVGFAPSILSAVTPDVAEHSNGTYLLTLKQALSCWGITSSYNGPSSDIRGAIASAHAGKPIIAHVTWSAGGGHWVVITHSMGNSHYVLDPYFGLAINSSFINYEGLEKPAGSSASSSSSTGSLSKVIYGTWTGEWLKIV